MNKRYAPLATIIGAMILGGVAAPSDVRGQSPTAQVHPWLTKNPLLGQDAQCPTCLPAVPKFNLPRKGLPQLSKLQFAQCQEAAADVRRLVPQNKSCFVGGTCVGPQAADAIQSYSTYVSSCLTPTTTLLATAASNVANDTRMQLSRFAVLSATDVPSPFCAALLLDDKTAVTAAHCLKGLNTESVRLQPWVDPGRRVAVSVIASPLPDWAVWLKERPVMLGLAEPVEGAEGRLCLDDPTEGERLELFGYMRDGLEDTSSQWASSVRTGTLACEAKSAVDDQRRCFAHDCQSYPGFSGAPLFGATTASCDVRVVGMQIAGLASAGNPCGGPDVNTAFAGGSLRYDPPPTPKN